jgi:hypothetical protein
MSGRLHYLGEKPQVGDVVLVHVEHAANYCPGDWEARLTDVGTDDRPENGYQRCFAYAKIVDERFPGTKSFSTSGYTHCDLYAPLAAIKFLRAKRAEDRLEINGLRRKIETLEGVFKLMFSSLGAHDLESAITAIADKVAVALKPKG